ncbi:MAG: hypothetical protein ACTSQE_06835 [Candidatus Heimdallarchaeaceae archaeon]
MTLKEFRKIEKLLEKAENEALNEGVDITSKKFQLLLNEIKTKLLADKGISLREYEEMEEKIEEKPKPYIPEGISMIKGDKGDMPTKEEVEKTVKKVVNNIKDELKAKDGKDGYTPVKNKDYFDGKDGRTPIAGVDFPMPKDGERGKDGKSIDKKEVEKMVKKETKKQLNDALKPSLFGKPKILSKKDIQKQIKDYMNKNLNIRIPFGGGGRTFQFADAEIPTGTVDGSNKTFTIANTPDPVTSLAVYVNTTRKTLTEDYTLSGATITMTSAPRSGAVIRCDYRY